MVYDIRMGLNKWPPEPKQSASVEVLTSDDVETEIEDRDEELLALFKRIPKELWVRHFNSIEQIAAEAEDPSVGNEQGKRYMEIIIEAREKAIVEYSISDAQLQKLWPEGPELSAKLVTILQKAFQSPENLGFGQTARVKRLDVEGIENSLAVKYLLTPTSKTLTIDAEHDMLEEVERITKIEEAEGRRGIGSRIRVPHPYFYFKRGKLQCYGMQEVQGVTFETLLHEKSTNIDEQDAILEAVRNRYASKESQAELFKEVDAFIEAMHEVCLHGDLKAKNLMIDTDGTIYLIDFGQSIATGVMTEETSSQFTDLSEQEGNVMHTLVRSLLLKASVSDAGAESK